MQRTTIGSRPQPAAGEGKPARFARIWNRESGEAVALLLGCTVVTAEGERIGRVDHLMVDVVTYQLRYVMVKRRNCALVAIPWQALYFDAANGRLVFYTWL
jgi:sporulation protein YlmC with PRC-barrel domain